MEALRASYGSDSDSDDSPPKATTTTTTARTARGGGGGGPPSRCPSKPPKPAPLPPPPLGLLDDLPHSLGYSPLVHINRTRSFPHVEGNYALHVFVPVIIPSTTRKQLASFIKRIASRVPDLFAIDVDMPLGVLCKEDQKLEQVLGREFHISLGRTVPIRVHQIDSIVDMLLQKFQSQRQYWIEFSKWEVFVNDDQTRSFLSLEVKGAGLSEDPRPHISLVWALGDISCALKQAIEEQSRCRNNLGSCQRHIFMCKFSGVECKIGKKSYSVCKFLS
uniref:U6 snRNA phosphodiesterase 1 n=1 Tax=Anthurium amnicola TaxID=1678845 RepID=A0A1D1YNA0_9ARAE